MEWGKKEKRLNLKTVFVCPELVSSVVLAVKYKPTSQDANSLKHQKLTPARFAKEK